MGWLPRKRDHEDAGEDPRIDYARRAVQNSGSGTQSARGQDERASDVPRGIDSDFCYNEDAGPCA